MSVYLKITTPGANGGSTTSWTSTKYLEDFSEKPSDTFTSDKNWTFVKADFSAYLRSVTIFTGDAWIRICKKDADSFITFTPELNPGSGKTYTYSILSYIKNYQGDFKYIQFRFSSDLSKNVSYSSVSITYVGVPYTLNTSRSGGLGTIKYSHNSSNDTAINLTATPDKGYKFVKWSNGSVEPTITFDPGEEGINQEFSLTAYFVPINYQINFHLMSNHNEEIEMQTLDCTYGISYPRPIFQIQNYYGLTGWYTSLQDECVNWYFDNKNLEFFGAESQYSLDSKVATDYCTTDQKVIDEYVYIIPYAYYINYHWIDSWGQTEEMFNLPSIIRKYGEGNVSILPIPSYPEYYNIDNENTLLWYLNNEKTALNTQEYINTYDTNNYDFYAFKSPLPRLIRLKSDNYAFGDVEPIFPPKENWIIEENEKTYYIHLNEGDLISFKALPKEDKAYFDNWSNDNNMPELIQNDIQVVLSKDYTAFFRFNQIYIGKKGIRGIYNNQGKPLTQINLGNKIISLKEE